MKKSSQNPNTILSDLPFTFIHLKEKTFAEYSIVYRINDCYSINKLTQIKIWGQLLFQKFSNTIHQKNLLIIDSVFPMILADLAVHTLTENISTFEEYINSKRFFIAVNPTYDKKYYTYKFRTFIQHLLFSNIASSNICKGEIETDKVYCLKNISSELEFYPIFRQFELQEMMLNKMRLEINFKNSSISKHKVILNLRIFIP